MLFVEEDQPEEFVCRMLYTEQDSRLSKAMDVYLTMSPSELFQVLESMIE